MQRLTAKLLLLTSGLLLSGCQNILANNECPAPVFPSCETVKNAAGPVKDVVWQDLADMTRVMIKLRERQEKDEWESFSTCRVVGVVASQ